MGNPTPSPAERQMAATIGGILSSPQCQRIDFTLRNNRISGSLYSIIAISSASPNNKTSNFGVKVMPMPAGTEARYNTDNNNMEVPTAAYGSTPFQRLTFVHEATHAALDARGRSSSPPRLLNETLAYIAGALFNVYSAPNVAGPFPYTPPAGNIYFQAHKLALIIRGNQDRYNSESNYSLTQGDVEALQAWIVASPTYHNFFVDPAATYGDNGVKL
jgi:hypothetical protein